MPSGTFNSKLREKTFVSVFAGDLLGPMSKVNDVFSIGDLPRGRGRAKGNPIVFNTLKITRIT